MNHGFAAALLALALGLGSTAVMAQVRGKTADGIPHVSGGISIEELRAMEQDKNRFSFWLTTAAKRSGAYLADVRVQVTNAKKVALFDGTMAGPWLMIDLPPGTYSLVARFKDQEQTASVRIRKGERQQMVLYFDSPAEVSPDWVSPFQGSPYGGK